MQTGVQVADAMTLRPITCTPSASLLECALLMKNMHVGSLIVRDGEKLLGMFTEQDMVRKAMTTDKPASQIMCSEIMEETLITIEPDADIQDALLLMADHNIRHLPVLHNGKMVGLITGKDILKLEPALFELLHETIELREQERKIREE